MPDTLTDKISMLVVFTSPMQRFALHSGSFPRGYPSSMIKGLCAGAQGDECPGPGVLMPRPGTPVP
jgi:hypothetical protein